MAKLIQANPSTGTALVPIPSEAFVGVTSYNGTSGQLRKFKHQVVAYWNIKRPDFVQNDYIKFCFNSSLNQAT